MSSHGRIGRAATRPRRRAACWRSLLDYAAGGCDPRPAGPARGAARPRRDAHRSRARRSSMTAIRSRSAASASGCAASTRRNTTRSAAATAPTIPAAGGRARRWPADRRQAGRLRGLGARPLRPAARRLHGGRRSISTARRSRPAGRSPMATIEPRRRRARSAGRPVGRHVRAAARLARRAWRDGREPSTTVSARSVNWLRADLRLFMTRPMLWSVARSRRKR